MSAKRTWGAFCCRYSTNVVRAISVVMAVWWAMLVARSKLMAPLSWRALPATWLATSWTTSSSRSRPICVANRRVMPSRVL